MSRAFLNSAGCSKADFLALSAYVPNADATDALTESLLNSRSLISSSMISLAAI